MGWGKKDPKDELVEQFTKEIAGLTEATTALNELLPKLREYQTEQATKEPIGRF